MKKFLLTAAVFSLLFISANSGDLEIWPEFCGSGFRYEAGYYYILTEMMFAVEIWAENNSDSWHQGWSSPFLFSGTGDVESLSYQEFIPSDTFIQFWDMGYMTAEESWDGQLPDQYCLAGISYDGFPPGAGPIKIGTFILRLA